jgi:hypothetical protein
LWEEGDGILRPSTFVDTPYWKHLSDLILEI